MRKLLLLCVLFVLLTSVWTSAGSPQSLNEDPVATMVPADDYHYHTTVNIGYNTYNYLSWSLAYHDGIYGNFEVTYPASGGDQIINFFICDQANFDIWTGGDTASVYHLQENVADYSFEFRIPSADTWYFVFKNYGLFVSKTVEVDLYRDDTPPAISMNLDAGATYSAIKEITATITEATFDISSVNLYIDGVLKDTETDSSFSYSWNTGSYSNGAHTVRITASDNVGNTGYEEVTVYVSNVIATSSTTSNTGGTTSSTGGGAVPPATLSVPLLIGGGVGVLALVGIAIVLMRKRSSIGGGAGPVTPIPPDKPDSPPVHSREVITERVMIVCPFCGSKTQQGTNQCQKCGADL